MNGTSGMRPKTAHATFAPALMSDRVARSIHMRMTASGWNRQTISSRSFFTPPEPTRRPAGQPPCVRAGAARQNVTGVFTLRTRRRPRALCGRKVDLREIIQLRRGPSMAAGHGRPADHAALWNGFANMASLAGRAVTIVGGEGATVFDAAGR